MPTPQARRDQAAINAALDTASLDTVRFMAEASVILGSSLDPDVTLDTVARLVVPGLADWCAVHLFSAGGDLVRLTVEHADPEKVAFARELMRRYPSDLQAPHGLGEVIRSARSQLYPEVTDAMLVAVARDEEHLALLRTTGIVSAMIIPLVARGRTLGALTLVAAESGRHYSEDDQRLVEAVCRHCAIAVDNARLFNQVQIAEARYRTLFEGVGESVWMLDEAGHVIDANPAFERLTGYTRRELLGMKVAELAIVPAANNGSAFNSLLGGPVSFETPVRRKDGTTVLLEVHTTVVSLDFGVAIVAIGWDIRERKQAEEAVRQANEELERRVEERTAALIEANQELEAFSYSVSHDLRAPLRSVDGFSRILLDDYAGVLPPEAQRYLNLVRGGAQRMGRLIDDMLTLSRLGRQPLRTESIDPATVVSQVLDELHSEIEHRMVTITVDPLPACQGDATLLKQVYLNLLGNALKYTRGREPARIEVGALTVDSQSREQTYYVRDNGVGFDMTYSHKLFGPFQRLHRTEEYEGTGVGLAIVQRLIHRLGGRVWAEATVGRGATFWFTLPAPAAAESFPRVAPASVA